MIELLKKTEVLLRKFKIVIILLFLLISTIIYLSFFSHSFLISYDSYEHLYFSKTFVDNLGQFKLGEYGDPLYIRSYNRIGMTYVITAFSYIVNTFNSLTNLNIEFLFAFKYFAYTVGGLISVTIYLLVRHLTKRDFWSIIGVLIFWTISSNIFYINSITSDPFAILILSLIVYISVKNPNNKIDLRKRNLILLILIPILSLFRFEYLLIIQVLYLYRHISGRFLTISLLSTLFLNFILFVPVYSPSWMVAQMNQFELLSDDIVIFALFLVGILLFKKLKFQTINLFLFCSSFLILIYAFYFDKQSTELLFSNYILNLATIISIYIPFLFYYFSRSNEIQRPIHLYFSCTLIMLGFYHTFNFQHGGIYLFFFSVLLPAFLLSKFSVKFLITISTLLILYFPISWYYLYLDVKVDIGTLVGIASRNCNPKSIAYSYFPITTYLETSISSRYLGSKPYDFGNLQEICIIQNSSILDSDILERFQISTLEEVNTVLKYNTTFQNIADTDFSKLYIFNLSKK